MSRVIITEADRTTPVSTYETTDVVFIPGFAVGGSAQRGEPKLCSSLAEFSQYFGTVEPRFPADQAYPSGTPGFAQAALVNLTGPWFLSGYVDPSFIYARELLAQGIPVVYERMNVNAEDITVVAAYDYLHTLVFCDTRSETISYPTATVYSATSTYDIGDIVSYNDAYYECIVEISTAEAWNSEHWKSLPLTQDTVQPLTDLALPVKYITSGGYPTHEYSVDIAGEMISMAELRGDCVALIDYLDNSNRKIVGDQSIYSSINYSSSFAAMFIPWVEVEFKQAYVGGTNGASNNHMPPSFAYLTALASTLAYSSNTQAIAGVTRGQIPNLVDLCTNYTLTNTIAETTFQPESGDGVSVNGITNISNYGYRIWGNRTMKANPSGTTATSFLNIRNMVSDIKKAVYNAAMLTLFEPNVQTTWLSFTSKITPVLDSLISNNGLTKYMIERNTVYNNGLPVPQTVLSATIIIYPVYSIEKIMVTIAIKDDDTIEIS